MSIDLSQQYTFNNKDPRKKVVPTEELVKLQSKQLDVSLPELLTIDSKAPQLQTNIPNNSQPDLNFGDKLQANPGNILTFGLGAYQQLSQTAQSDKEADARTLSLAANGASAGMTFGPWGAAVGGVIGLGAGLLKKGPDRKKRLIADYKKYEETNTRDALAEDDMRKAEVESLMDLKKAQMGLINLNY